MKSIILLLLSLLIAVPASAESTTQPYSKEEFKKILDEYWDKFQQVSDAERKILTDLKNDTEYTEATKAYDDATSNLELARQKPDLQNRMRLSNEMVKARYRVDKIVTAAYARDKSYQQLKKELAILKDARDSYYNQIRKQVLDKYPETSNTKNVESKERTKNPEDKSLADGKNSEIGLGIGISAFRGIEDGMSYRQVVQIIGCDGTELSHSYTPGIPDVMESLTISMYQWSNNDGGNMIVMFENDKVTLKSQYGLH